MYYYRSKVGKDLQDEDFAKIAEYHFIKTQEHTKDIPVGFYKREVTKVQGTTTELFYGVNEAGAYMSQHLHREVSGGDVRATDKYVLMPNNGNPSYVECSGFEETQVPPHFPVEVFSVNCNENGYNVEKGSLNGDLVKGDKAWEMLTGMHRAVEDAMKEATMLRAEEDAQ